MAKPKYDSILVKDQLQGLQHVLQAWGTEMFCQAMFWLLTKAATDIPGVEKSKLVPFYFNLFQRKLFPALQQRNRVLKPRQPGSTTFFALVRLFLPVITNGGENGLLVSQNAKYAAEQFQMIRRAYRHIGVENPYKPETNAFSNSLKANLLHTVYSNRRELVFDAIDSKIVVESAEVEEAAQSLTLHHVVSSETARWPGNPAETTSNIKGALVGTGTYDEESTANGMGGYFAVEYLHGLVDEKAAGARSHYFSWWCSEDYVAEMSEKEKDEMMLDLTAEERQIIRRIHHDLQEVTWPRKAAA